MTKSKSLCLTAGATLRHSSFVVSSSFFLLCLMIPVTGFPADNIGILGSKPKWDVLENYQRTITHDEFAHLINDVYCTHGLADDLIKIDDDAAQILTNRDPRKVFTLHFASDPNSTSRVPRLWRPAKLLPSA